MLIKKQPSLQNCVLAIGKKTVIATVFRQVLCLLEKVETGQSIESGYNEVHHLHFFFFLMEIKSYPHILHILSRKFDVFET